MVARTYPDEQMIMDIVQQLVLNSQGGGGGGLPPVYYGVLPPASPFPTESTVRAEPSFTGPLRALDQLERFGFPGSRLWGHSPGLNR